MQPSISLCMIVKDEEKYIERCLESVKGIFDEIVIVDTGSQDKTISIAKSFGARIVFHQWQDNFSISRNISLEHATGDWIFILDADEWLCQKSKVLFKDLIDKKDILGYHVFRKPHPDWTESTIVRMFRNLPELRFRGIFHETLMLSEEQRDRVLMSDLKIYHEPWTEKSEKSKSLRNIRILEKHLKEYPEDVYQILDLARSKIKAEKFPESKDLLTRALLVIKKRRFRKDLHELYLAHYYLYLMHYYSALGDKSGSLSVCEKAVLEIPMYPLFYFEAANLCYEIQEYDRALGYFKKCLAFNKNQEYGINMIFPKAILGSQSLAGLGYCYFRKKQYKQAAQYFKDSLALKNDVKIKSMYHSAITLSNHPHLNIL